MSPLVRMSCALAVALLGSLPAGAAPAVTFGPSTVTVSGLTPKGKGVLLSVAREIERYSTTVVRREEVPAWCRPAATAPGSPPPMNMTLWGA